MLANVQQVITRILALLTSRDPAQARQAIEMTIALDEPEIYATLLRHCRLDEQAELHGNPFLHSSRGREWGHFDGEILRAFLVLISHAPPQAVDSSLRRENIQRLHIRAYGGVLLPPDLSRLHALRRLEMPGTGLKGRPEEGLEILADLPALEALDLTRNQLAGLPAVVLRIPRLRELILDFNPLPALPAGIGALADLERLSLVGTSLSTLPPEIGGLARLADLDLSRTGLTALPPELAGCRALRRLTLRNTRARVEPGLVARLEGLRELHLNPGMYADPRRHADALRAARPGLVVNVI